jgi:hypothetical protein
VDEAAICGHEVGCDKAVAGEAVLAHQPADAASEREAADPVDDEATGRRFVCQCLVVDIGPDGAPPMSRGGLPVDERPHR